MVCLSRPYPFKFSKDCPPQNLLVPNGSPVLIFLNKTVKLQFIWHSMTDAANNFILPSSLNTTPLVIGWNQIRTPPTPSYSQNNIFDGAY